MTRSPESRNLGQVAPRAGEEGVWVGKGIACTSLALATHSFVWKRNVDIRVKKRLASIEMKFFRITAGYTL